MSQCNREPNLPTPVYQTKDSYPEYRVGQRQVYSCESMKHRVYSRVVIYFCPTLYKELLLLTQIFSVVKYVNRYFTKKDKYIAVCTRKDVQPHERSRGTCKQITALMRYYCKPTRIAKIKRTDNTQCQGRHRANVTPIPGGRNVKGVKALCNPVFLS